jgi:hypothetical protein
MPGDRTGSLRKTEDTCAGAKANDYCIKTAQSPDAVFFGAAELFRNHSRNKT